MHFVEFLKDRCGKNPRRLALPESLDPRIRKAAEHLLDEKLVTELVMIGNDRDYKSLTKDCPSLISSPRFRWQALDPDNELKDPIENLVSCLEEAARLLRDGVVDACLAGASAKTSQVVRAAISGVGLQPGVRTVSGSFIMYDPKSNKDAFIFADCGVVIKPTQAQLQDIAIESVRTFQRTLGRWQTEGSASEPKVAFLSFATKGSADSPEVDFVRGAALEFRKRYPEILSDGELQVDAAILPEVAARKAPASPVAGRANILIFPDLNTGNIAYKIAERLGGYQAFGPILQGLRVPYSDLSRGCSVTDIVTSAMIQFLRSRCESGDEISA
jgi:phosphate acetyltransferase